MCLLSFRSAREGQNTRRILMRSSTAMRGVSPYLERPIVLHSFLLV